MGERDRNRQIVEAMAVDIKRHHEAKGERITSEQARDQAASVARRRDMQRADGLHRNKAKGAASGRIKEREAQERRERKASERTIRAKGRVVIDIGRGKK